MNLDVLAWHVGEIPYVPEYRSILAFSSVKTRQVTLFVPRVWPTGSSVSMTQQVFEQLAGLFHECQLPNTANEWGYRVKITARTETQTGMVTGIVTEQGQCKQKIMRLSVCPDSLFGPDNPDSHDEAKTYVAITLRNLALRFPRWRLHPDGWSKDAHGKERKPR